MPDIATKRTYGRSNATERLLSAIGYPERMPNADGSFTLRVDGRDVLVKEAAGRLVLSHALTEDGSIVPTLAAYAAGRMLREAATLAHGRNSTFLWQDAPVDADDRALVKLFETFADSCDWWRARVDEWGKVDAVEISEAVIRP
ncbi:MAG: type III secretion system chaperone [Kiritimatiellae bacterium]|nr:type III secretion system chaperone [Kiritimatiellia bacterium]